MNHTAPVNESGTRKEDSYAAVVLRIHDHVSKAVPPGATVAVVSKGDDELIKLNGRRGWHFPQNKQGVYAGYYPENSPAAIWHLEELRSRGAEFLLVPATAFWWLDHYADFYRHLQTRHSVILRDEQACLIVDLRAGPVANVSQPTPADALPHTGLTTHLRELVECLLPEDAVVAVASSGEPPWQLGNRRTVHLPPGRSRDHAGVKAVTEGEAIRWLQTVIDLGAEFLVLPEDASWWPLEYRDLKRYLESHARLITEQPHVCTLFELGSERL